MPRNKEQKDDNKYIIETFDNTSFTLVSKDLAVNTMRIGSLLIFCYRFLSGKYFSTKPKMLLAVVEFIFGVLLFYPIYFIFGIGMIGYGLKADCDSSDSGNDDGGDDGYDYE